MATELQSKSAEIRARLNHPVIDSDGHTLEPFAIFFDYLKSVAGEHAPGRFSNSLSGTQLDPRWSTFSPEQRRRHNLARGPWWAVPAMNTLDLATAMLPKLMYERMDEMGLDFGVVYPTIGLITMGIGDEEMRRASCRALNIMKADMFSGLSDRIVPVATIPMHTPQEAIDELEYSVRRLGLKASMMASYVRRPIPQVASEFPKPPAIRIGWTHSDSTASTTTIRSGRNVWSSELRLPFIRWATDGAVELRSQTTSTIISAILLLAPRQFARASSWAAYRHGFRGSGSPSSRAERRGRGRSIVN